MTAVTTRDALAKALGEHAPVYDYRNGHFTMECEACDFRLGGVDRADAKRRFGEHFADALLASGVVIDFATLADDKTLVEVIAADQKEAADSWGEPLGGSECTFRARTALRALAAALAERAR